MGRDGCGALSGVKWQLGSGGQGRASCWDEAVACGGGRPGAGGFQDPRCEWLGSGGVNNPGEDRLPVTGKLVVGGTDSQEDQSFEAGEACR